MNYLGTKLKKLRKRKGLNQEELAAEMGVRKSAISNYETGYSTPPLHMLLRLADFFSVTVDELTGGTTQSPSLCESAPDTAPTAFLSPGLESPCKSVPVYTTAAFSFDTQPLYYLQLPAPLLGEGTFFALKIAGDRMARSLLTDGSLAIIRSQSFADDGEIAAVSIGSEPTVIGRFYRSGEVIMLTAESDNPLYLPVLITPGEQKFKILGKVVKVIQSVQ